MIGAANTTVTLNKGQGITIKSTQPNATLFQQYLDRDTVSGKTIIMSCLTTNEFHSATFNLPSSGVFDSGNVNFDNSTWYVDFFSNEFLNNNNLISIRIVSSSSNVNTTIVAIKVEIGNKQTLCHYENGQWVLNTIPQYELEYAKCKQRSYIDGYSIKLSSKQNFFAYREILADTTIPTNNNLPNGSVWLVYE